MSDHQQILEEEFEVLESIFPEELEKISDTEIRIRIEPEEPVSSHPLRLNLLVVYPLTYPDVIPELSLEEIEDEDEDEVNGELLDGEREEVLSGLRILAEESLGMAMTFTIASAAREALSGVVARRIQRETEEDNRRTREYEEAEAKKKRGTPMTPAAYTAWRIAYAKELKAKREKEEEERVKALPPKEREEWRRRRDRPSGRQLFETSKALANSDEALIEDGVAEVDLSQYTREEREMERRRIEEEEDRRRSGLVGDEGDSDGE